jgi:MscS family membrane protein
MPLLRENRRGISSSLNWTYIVHVALAFFLFVGSAAHSSAQIPTSATPPPAKAEPAVPLDPLGRETPLSAMMSFLKYEDHDDFSTAARCLQSTPGRDTNLTQRAKEFQALHPSFEGNLGLLSDDPNGTIEPGLPPGQVRAGVLAVGGTTADIILVRVDDPASGKIWLISRETVASFPKLYSQLKSEAPTTFDQIMPSALSGRRVLGISLAQWLGWLLSIPVSWLLAWLLGLLLSAPRRLWCKLRGHSFRTVWETPLGMPLRCVMAILIHSLCVHLLNPPLLYRVYYFRIMAALLVGCIVWLVSRITDTSFDHAVNRMRTQRKGGESILILVQRLTHVVLLIIALVIAFSMLGFNMKTALAGLGIGGLAIALAAQKTLENLIGGVSLLMDKAVHVGDFCRIGDQRGTVEDIGLRSLKLRTLDQNLLTVPNGLLAQMQFENLASRPKLLINQNFSLRIETQAEQLRFVLDRVQSMLDEHSAIESGTSRVRVANLAGAAFELELFAYGKTGDWPEFTAIRQDVILKIAEIVEAAGARFAAPTRLTYLSRDVGIDTEKADGDVHREIEHHASDTFRFPGEATPQARTGTK